MERRPTETEPIGMPSETVVRVGEEHLSAIAEIERLCFAEPWSETALALLLRDEARGVAVTVDGEAVAYGGMLLAFDEGQITSVAVHPHFRRRGYGARVVRELIALGREMGLVQLSLEVRQSNEAAIALYESVGFRVEGRRKRFYKFPSEDALIMLCPLT